METRNETTRLLPHTIAEYQANNKMLEKEISTRDNYQIGKLLGLVSGMMLSCAVLPMFAMLPFMGNFMPILIAAAMPGVLSLGFAVLASSYATKAYELNAEIRDCQSSDMKVQLLAKADKAEKRVHFYNGARVGAFYGALFCMMVAAVVPLFFPAASVMMPVAMEIGSMTAAGLLNLVIHTVRNALTHKKIAANNERIREIQAANAARGTTQQLTATLQANSATAGLTPPPMNETPNAGNSAAAGLELAAVVIDPAPVTEEASLFSMRRS